MKSWVCAGCLCLHPHHPHHPQGHSSKGNVLETSASDYFFWDTYNIHTNSSLFYLNDFCSQTCLILCWIESMSEYVPSLVVVVLWRVFQHDLFFSLAEEIQRSWKIFSKQMYFSDSKSNVTYLIELLIDRVLHNACSSSHCSNESVAVSCQDDSNMWRI